MQLTVVTKDILHSRMIFLCFLVSRFQIGVFIL